MDDSVLSLVPRSDGSVPAARRGRRRPQSNMSYQPHNNIVYVAILSAFMVFSYNVLLDGIFDGQPASPTWVEPALRRSDQRRRLEIENYIDKRIAEVFRETWPECVEERLTAVECKEFIDEEILSTFTERDKYIRVIIKGKRSTGNPWYNTVVITMNDSDMVVGIDGDGLVYYDFEWESSGKLSTPGEQGEIPPILASETPAGSPHSVPLGQLPPDHPLYVPEADPTREEYDPLVFVERPWLVWGSDVEGALLGNSTDPIAGGVVINSTTPNETPEADANLQAAIDESPLNPSNVNTTGDGGSNTTELVPRILPTFDCAGMTGYNCCLMIKLMVPDSDIYGKAIQCQLIYQEGTDKERFWLNSRGKKVFVYANHNGFVNKIPHIVGDWPKGVDNFTSWLEDGGDPNQVLNYTRV